MSNSEFEADVGAESTPPARGGTASLQGAGLDPPDQDTTSEQSPTNIIVDGEGDRPQDAVTIGLAQDHLRPQSTGPSPRAPQNSTLLHFCQ